MATRIRLLVAVPGAGRSGDIVELPREEAVTWVDVGRAEFLGSPPPQPRPAAEARPKRR